MIARWTLLGCALLVTLSCDSATEPATPITELASRSISWAGGTRVTSSALFFRMIAEGTGDTLFNGTSIVPGDEGRSVVADAGDPGFAGMVARLTNGVDETIRLRLQLTASGIGGYGEIGHESTFFNSKTSPGPDFQGFEIESIRFVIEAVGHACPGSDPNHDGIWTDYMLRGRLVVRGRPL